MSGSRFVRPIRHRSARVASLVALIGASLVMPAATLAAPFDARAHVEPNAQYLNDTAGTVFTFSVTNSGTVSSIGAVEIDRPSNQWTIVACPAAPAGWSIQRSDAMCRYRSASGTGDDLLIGGTTTFQVAATTLGGTADRTGTWKVIVSKSDHFNNKSLLRAAAAEPPGLGIKAYSWEVLDAIVDGAPATPGEACPAATPENHSAITGSSGHTIVICGRNRMNVAATPLASRSSLGGTFVTGAGAFASGSIPANSASSVVLGTWSDVSITTSAGAGKTVVATIGSASNQTSPSTTLTGYEATNQPPVAVDDSYSTNEDTPLTVPSGAILSNDTDPDGDPITAVLVTEPAHGTLSLSPDGSFDYTPDADFNGIDSFTYKARDGFGADSNVATVSITVNPVNDAPVAVNDSYTTDEDTQLTVAAPVGVLVNDADADGDTLAAILVSGPAHGTLTLHADGSFSYAPAPNYNGTDSFTYKANDGTADSNVATVAITVSSVNDAPTASNDSYGTNEDTVLNVAAPGVLANDADPDGDPITAVLVTGPANGALTLDADGSFSYAPDLNYSGTDSFTYKANDGSADSNIASVNITVGSVNDAPVAVNDSYTTDEDTQLTVAAPVGVLVNDADADGDTLAAILVSGPAHGTLTLNADGSFSYAPAPNYNGTDSFTYKANDGTADSNVGTVTITVTSVNDAPIANDDSYDAGAAGVLSVTSPGVLANDADADGDPLTAVLVTGPSNADSFVLNADGSFSYTATAGTTSDSFTYMAKDGDVDSNVATVTIAINTPPVADAQAVSTNEDTPKAIVLGGSDADDDGLTFSIVGGPAHGMLGSIGAPDCTEANTCTASVTYTPDVDFAGADSFTFRVNDGSANSAPATVTITIDPVNDAPVLAGIEGGAVAFTEGDAATGVTSTITVADVDSTTLAVGKVAIIAGYQPGADVLAATPPVGITASFNAATGVLLLTGSASPADHQAALRSVTFANTSDNPSTATRTLSFLVDDGTDASNTLVRDLAVTAVNDPPVNTVPAAQTVNEDTGLVFSSGGGNAISVADMDAGSGSVEVVVSALNGTITPASGSGATITGSGTNSASITGTLAQVNAALNGLAYLGGPNWNSTRGTETLTVVTSDQGNTGAGGAQSDSDTIGITVNAVNDAPTALAKGYGAQANMKITGLTGLLTGATDPDTGDGGYTATLTVGTLSATSPAGGTIGNVNTGTGTFDFDPPPGATGNVTFTYTVCDTGNPGPSACSAPATVTVSVAGPVIWFVNPAAGVNGDGRLSSPFNSLASAAAVDGSGHRIFVYSGTASGGITLASDEWLIGQGVTGTSFDALFPISPPAGTIARPAINGTRPVIGGSVVLATSDAVRGLNIQPTSGTAGLTASGATSLTVGEVSVTTTNAAAVSLASSGGTISLTSVSANGGSNGIILNGTTGSFTVTGSGGTCTAGDKSGCSGGTIQNMTGGDDAGTTPVGTGIALNNAASVSLTRVWLHDHTNYGIRGTGVNGFTLANSVIDGTNGTSSSGTYADSSVYFNNAAGVGLQGSASITSTYVGGGFTNNIWVLSSSGSLNRITLDGVIIGANSTAGGNKGVHVQGLGSATVNVTVRNSVFTSSRGDLFSMVADGTGGGDLDFDSNSLSNNHPAIATGGGGVSIFGGAAGTFHFNIHGTNTFRNALGHGLLIVKSAGTGSANGTITGAQIGVAATANSGSLEGSGIKIQHAGTSGAMTVAVTNNTVAQYNNDGILLQAGAGAVSTGTFDVTVTGNTVGPLGTNIAAAQGVGIRLSSGTIANDAFQTCAQIGGAGALRNTLTNSGIAGSDSDYRVRQRFGTTVRLPGYAGAAGDTGAVVTFVDGNNTITAPAPGGTATADYPATGGGYVGGAACAQPTP